MHVLTTLSDSTGLECWTHVLLWNLCSQPSTAHFDCHSREHKQSRSVIGAQSSSKFYKEQIRLDLALETPRWQLCRLECHQVWLVLRRVRMVLRGVTSENSTNLHLVANDPLNAVGNRDGILRNFQALRWGTMPLMPSCPRQCMASCGQSVEAFYAWKSHRCNWMAHSFPWPEPNLELIGTMCRCFRCRKGKPQAVQKLSDALIKVGKVTHHSTIRRLIMDMPKRCRECKVGLRGVTLLSCDASCNDKCYDEVGPGYDLNFSPIFVARLPILVDIDGCLLSMNYTE